MSSVERLRLKHLVTLINEDAQTASGYVGLEQVDPWTGRYTITEKSEGNARAFHPGDVMFGKLRPYLAKAFVARDSASCSSELLVLRPGPRLSAEYLGYVLLEQGFIREVDSSTFGARMPRANWEFIGNLRVSVPTIATQNATAAFLDRKTAAIDALIEKKQKLLGLLAEKRAALINQAVTKGLDPNVPMKDSGIPWIGEIPAHWHTRKLRYIAAKLQGRIIVQPHLYFANEGVPIVFGYNIKDAKIDEGGLSKISYEADAAHSHARAQAGDLYTVRLGSPGMTAVVPQSLDGCHFASIMWVHQHERADSHWLCHAMNSAVVQGQIDAANYGATLSQFNIADAVDWVLPFPPKEEQCDIANFLSSRLDNFTVTRRSIEKQVERLQEYRQALITAAVTGQLEIN